MTGTEGRVWRGMKNRDGRGMRALAWKGRQDINYGRRQCMEGDNTKKQRKEALLGRCLLAWHTLRFCRWKPFF
jgi:hypothetical protein